MKINDELFDKHYQKNDIIYMQDDHADELCLVLKGRVRVYHITKNGDEINYDVLDKGRIFGESSLYENAYRPTTVSAINDVEIITCHLEDLYPYLSSSLDLTITLLKMFNDNCNHLTQLLKWAQTYDRFEKVLNQFKDEGLISIEYGHIKVLKRDKLYEQYLSTLV